MVKYVLAKTLKTRSDPLTLRTLRNHRETAAFTNAVENHSSCPDSGVPLRHRGDQKAPPTGLYPLPLQEQREPVVRAPSLLQKKPEVLSSSREALVVTERRYLRRDWCKTQPLRQTISEEGCQSRTVVNRFCYGQCNSFYIPRHLGPSSGSGSGRKHHNKLQEPFQSCSFCRPQRITQLTVQLDCPDLQPPFRHRKVQRSNSVAACLWRSAATASSETNTAA
ncbi:hypothetical protein WMY93_018667 [Mugilogobius chulae]|uniref:CTCK domain-containing protein n=1 Tax=Mugilogobius chulae TaxID=88201 RepID=A0AAW0NMB9_9GOBI